MATFPENDLAVDHEYATGRVGPPSVQGPGPAVSGLWCAMESVQERHPRPTNRMLTENAVARNRVGARAQLIHTGFVEASGAVLDAVDTVYACLSAHAFVTVQAMTPVPPTRPGLPKNPLMRAAFAPDEVSKRSHDARSRREGPEGGPAYCRGGSATFRRGADDGWH